MKKPTEADLAAARAAFDIPGPGVVLANRCAFCGCVCPLAACWRCSTSVEEFPWPDDDDLTPTL